MNLKLLRISLLGACSLLPACANLPQLNLSQPRLEQTSGTASGDVPLTILAVHVNPELLADSAPPTGPDAPDPATVRAFVAKFSYVFADGFPERLAEHGVRPHEPGYGIPLLRMSISDYRPKCVEPGNCQTELHLSGSVLDSGGARLWSFSDWIVLEEMDAAGYQNLADRMLRDMVRDRVVPRGG